MDYKFHYLNILNFPPNNLLLLSYRVNQIKAIGKAEGVNLIPAICCLYRIAKYFPSG